MGCKHNLRPPATKNQPRFVASGLIIFVSCSASAPRGRRALSAVAPAACVHVLPSPSPGEPGRDDRSRSAYRYSWRRGACACSREHTAGSDSSNARACAGNGEKGNGETRKALWQSGTLPAESPAADKSRRPVTDRYKQPALATHWRVGDISTVISASRLLRLLHRAALYLDRAARTRLSHRVRHFSPPCG